MRSAFGITAGKLATSTLTRYTYILTRHQQFTRYIELLHASRPSAAVFTRRIPVRKIFSLMVHYTRSHRHVTISSPYNRTLPNPNIHPNALKIIRAESIILPRRGETKRNYSIREQKEISFRRTLTLIK